jgi:predicted O-methyltransferase YrrM
LKSGGILIADNVLWSGKVVEEKKDADTECIHAFNQKINTDIRVENVLLPIRDGLMMVRKK